jgi:cell division septation protein DedD
MKKIILFALLTTVALARVENDVSLTTGYNNFSDDDDQLLYDDVAFYGIRAGAIVDDTYGVQVGYEQTQSANCQDLTLQRYYVNGILQTRLKNALKPYAVATLGYETSDKEYRPNQAFLGLGGGVKYNFSNHANVFLETRVLKSMESKNVAWSTTLGLGYTFDTAIVSQSQKPTASHDIVPVAPRKSILKPVRIKQVTPTPINIFYTEEKVVVPKRVASHTKSIKHGYYVQIAALESSSATPYITRLNRHGFHNVEVKRVEKRRLVVVGPYKSRSHATNALRKLKSISAGAFIKRF